MLYLAPGAAFVALIVTAIRYSRRLDEEAKALIHDVTKDLGQIFGDAVNCFIHTIFLYFVMIALGVVGETAIATSVSVGAIKMFSSDNVHPTNYLHRTRKRLVERFKRDE